MRIILIDMFFFFQDFDGTVSGARGGRGEVDGSGDGGRRDGIIVNNGQLIVGHMLAGRMLEFASHFTRPQKRAITRGLVFVFVFIFVFVFGGKND